MLPTYGLLDRVRLPNLGQSSRWGPIARTSSSCLTDLVWGQMEPEYAMLMAYNVTCLQKIPALGRKFLQGLGLFSFSVKKRNDGLALLQRQLQREKKKKTIGNCYNPKPQISQWPSQVVLSMDRAGVSWANNTFSEPEHKSDCSRIKGHSPKSHRKWGKNL